MLIALVSKAAVNYGAIEKHFILEKYVERLPPTPRQSTIRTPWIRPILTMIES